LKDIIWQQTGLDFDALYQISNNFLYVKYLSAGTIYGDEW